MEVLGAAAVLGDVVGGPHASEVVAAHRQLTDELGEVAVVGVAGGFGAEAADGCCGEVFPSSVEDARPRVEEHEAGQADRPVEGRERVGVQRVGEPVAGEEVGTRVADERGGVGDRVEDPLHGRSHLQRRCPRPVRELFGGAGQIEQMGAFDVVELQERG